MSVTVNVLNSKEIVTSLQLKAGETHILEAQNNVNYQLISDQTGYAPQNILTARVGNDLVITFEETDIPGAANKPSLIIQDYYAQDGESNLIIGVHENGNTYAYIPESALEADAVTVLAEEMVRPQVLGGTELSCVCWVFNPWCLTLPALFLSAGAAAFKRVSYKEANEDKTIDPPSIEKTPQGFLITPAPNASKMAVSYQGIDGTPQVIEVQKDANGNWVPKAGTTLPAGVTIDPATGVVNIPRSEVATGSKIIAAKDGNDFVESVDLTEPYEIAPIVTIDPISKGDTEITGTVNDPNAKVEITLPNGTKVPAVVDPTPVVLPDGTTVYQYTAQVPAGVELPENAQVTANATDSEGKVPSQPAVAKAPEVSIEVNSVALDDVVNQMEAGSETVPVTGKVTGDFNAGDTVTLTINGTKYTGTVNPDGTYSIDVKGADLIADKTTGDGKIDASITTTKVPAGSKPYTKEADPYPYDVKTAAPEVEIDPIVKGDATITGVVNDPEATVEITLPDGTKVPAKVDPTPIVRTKDDGTTETVYKFEAPVPTGTELDENDTVSAIASDPFGNTSTPDETIAPQVSIEVNNVTKDDIISKAESGEENLPVTGVVTGDFNAGDTVTLIVNGKEHTGTVNEDGTYSIDVPVADLLADEDGKVDAKITSTAGVRPFTTEMPEPYPYEIDVVSEVTLDPIKAGNTELKIIAEPGSDVVVTLPDGTELKGKTDENGDLVLPLPKDTVIEEGQSVSVVATDKVGNVSEASTQKAPELTIVIDTVAKDQFVNGEEAKDTEVPVTGTVTGDFNAGDTVTLTINGVEYTGTVDEEGKFSIPVKGADLVADEDSAVDAKVTGTKGSQPYTKEAEPKPYTVDTEITVDLQPIKAGDTKLTVKTEPNANVVVTLSDGTEVKGTADENGDLVLDLPEGTVIKEGQTATAVASDEAGNTAEDTEKAPGVDIFVNSVAEDDIVNALEAGSETVPVTGKVTGDVNPGDTVTLTINNVEYTGTVNEDGTFSIDVKGADLVADKETGDGKVDAKVLATGGSQPYEKAAEPYPYEVDTQAPKVTIDQIIKGDETITGTVDDPEATVTITLPNGDTITAVVDKDNPNDDGTYNFKAAVPEGVTLNEKDTVKAKAEDEAGNPSEEVQTQAPKVTITIDTVATDNILNKEESESQTVPVTGKVDGDFAEGDTVTLKVNGTDYTGVVDKDGNFSIPVNGDDLLKDADKKLEANVESSKGGRTYSASEDAQKPYEVDTQAPKVTIDQIIKGDEEITGTVDDPDATVTITLPNGDTISAVVDKDNPNDDGTYNFKAAVPEGVTLNEKDTVKAKAEDEAGNPSEEVETEAPQVTITIDTVATDNILNKEESESQTVPVTGKVDGDFAEGDTVTLKVNGTDYTGTVDKDGNFSIDVLGSDLENDADKKLEANVESSKGGRTYSASEDAQKPYEVDTQAPKVTIDQIIKGDEEITGTVDDPEATVTITLPDGTPVIAEVDPTPIERTKPDGTTETVYKFKAAVPEGVTLNEKDTVKANAEDEAGNPSEEVQTQAPQVTITIDTVATDNILNKEESESQTVPVTGKVDGDFAEGDTVTLKVNGTDYTGTVDKDGNFSIDVLGSDLEKDADKTITANVESSKGGRTYSASEDAQKPYDVDTQAPKVTIDQIIKGDEEITGTVDDPDATVTITLPNGDTVTAVVDKDNPNDDGTYNFKAAVPEGVTLNEKDTVKAEAEDKAGNVSEPAQTQAPKVTITIDTVATDNILNKEESESQTVPVTGKVDGDFAAGDTVALIINDVEYTTTVDEEGNFSVDVLGSDLEKDADKTITANVESSKGGRTYSASEDAQKPYEVDTQAPKVTIDQIIKGDQEITGTVDDPEATVTITLPNGDTVTAVVDKDNPNDDGTYNFKAAVPEGVTLNEKDTVKAEAEDKAGNVSEPAQTQAPQVTITIDTVATDNILNKEESESQTVPVTGKVDGDFAAGDTVTLIINNVEYTTTVDEEGNFSVDVLGSDLEKDADKTITANVESSKGGRTYSASEDAQKPYDVDTQAPKVDLDPILAGDTELTGKTKPNATVTVEFPDGSTETVTADEQGNFKIENIPADRIKAKDILIATATDPAGNTSEPDSERAPELKITVNDVTEDNIINAQESGEKIEVAGKVEGDFAEGDIVTLTINGTDYTAAVDKEGNFSIEVEGSDLSKDDDASIEAKVSSNPFGREVEAEAVHEYEVDTEAPIIDLNPINAYHDKAFTGTVNDPDATVIITLPDGSTIEATVDKNNPNDDGTYNFTAPFGDSDEEGQRMRDLLKDNDKVKATATDEAGNSADDTESVIIDRDFDGIPDSVEDGEEGYDAPEAAVKAAEEARKAYDEALEKFGKTNGTNENVNPEEETYSQAEIDELTKLKEALDKAIEDANKAIEDMIAKVVDPNHTNEDLTKGPTEEDQGVINGYKARIPDPVEVPEVNDRDDDGISDETEDSYRAELQAAKDALEAAEKAFHKLHTDAHADGEIETGEASALTQAANAVANARAELDELYALYDEKTGTGGETDFDKEDKPNYEHKECLTPWVTTPMIQEKQNSKGTFEQSEMVVKTFADNMEVIIRYTDEKGTNKVLVLGRDAWGGELKVKAVSEYLEVEDGKGVYSDPIEQHWVNHGFNKAGILAGQTESQAELQDMITIKGTQGSEEIYFHPNAVKDGSTITATSWNNLIPFGNDYITAAKDCSEDGTDLKEAISEKEFEEVPGDFMLGGTGFAMDNGNHIYINAIGALWQANQGSADKSIVPFDNAKPMLEVTAGEETYYVSRVANGRSKQEYAVFKPVEDQGATKYEFVEWIDWDRGGNPNRTQYNQMLDSLKTNNKIFYAHGNSLMINKLALGGEDVEVKLKTHFGTNERGLGVSKHTEVAEGDTLEITKIAGTTQIITGKGTVDLGGDGAESLGGFTPTGANAADFVGFYGNDLGAIGNYKLYVHGPLPTDPSGFANAVYTNQDYGIHFVLIHNDITVI